MAKNKKLTYKQIANYVLDFEMKAQNAVNTIGQTITDYIEFKGETDKFMDFLKNKYKGNNDVPNKEKEDKSP